MTDQFQLTEDQLAIQDMARKFTADAITPFAAEWDEKAHFPRDVIKQAAELGFAAIYVSEESGGIGLGRLEAALIMEAMSYGCPATSAFISIHNMASWMIDSFGGGAVKAKFLPDLVTMDRMASYCLTEPGSGSDAAALKTTPDEVPARVVSLLEERKRLERELAEAKKALAMGGGSGAPTQVEQAGGVAFIGQVLDGFEAKGLRGAVDEAKQRLGSGVAVLVAVNEGRASVAVGVTDDLVARFSAVELVKRAVAAVGGQGGGGRLEMAQGGGPDAAKADEALAAVRAALDEARAAA